MLSKIKLLNEVSKIFLGVFSLHDHVSEFLMINLDWAEI